MLGGWYFWQQSNVESTADLPLIPGDEVSGEAWVPPTSNSDDAAAIETELEAMDMSSFEAMMNADVEATDAAL
jgi:hypothetical protein